MGLRMTGCWKVLIKMQQSVKFQSEVKIGKISLFKLINEGCSTKQILTPSVAYRGIYSLLIHFGGCRFSIITGEVFCEQKPRRPALVSQTFRRSFCNYCLENPFCLCSQVKTLNVLLKILLIASRACGYPFGQFTLQSCPAMTLLNQFDINYRPTGFLLVRFSSVFCTIAKAEALQWRSEKRETTTWSLRGSHIERADLLFQLAVFACQRLFYWVECQMRAKVFSRGLHTANMMASAHWFFRTPSKGSKIAWRFVPWGETYVDCQYAQTFPE